MVCVVRVPQYPQLPQYRGRCWVLDTGCWPRIRTRRRDRRCYFSWFVGPSGEVRATNLAMAAAHSTAPRQAAWATRGSLGHTWVAVESNLRSRRRTATAARYRPSPTITTATRIFEAGEQAELLHYWVLSAKISGDSGQNRWAVGGSRREFFRRKKFDDHCGSLGEAVVGCQWSVVSSRIRAIAACGRPVGRRSSMGKATGRECGL